ncbi:MBL fold metallo-hydrolase [Streptomonospora salina]|uniref:Glyoxylase-like metal-dependent hydrolase (Beta-lactamase superfamily II) n=1 Tax=Streptomonospora salina TaxID=104205 RepID=A0A841EDH5_9ACTN|nr:MBL fold metallo-hydrolase [Streptomonospora salina]MBB5997491.1 glyoxylase-like metal-dependent hydrolase (beta-lactamase superfamily II) [Streptomonospora salina]
MRTLPPVEDLGEGVWSVPVPIPGNPLGFTLIYALHTPRGPVLVDAGWNHEDSWQALASGLEIAGTRVSDVHGVVLTHFHPDHSGLAGRVRETSGAWIAMHRADADLVRGFARIGADEQHDRQLRRTAGAGASAAELERLARTAPRFEPPALPDHDLSDGEPIGIGSSTLRAVWTPGHTPGHICLDLDDGARLFTGDHVLPGITPHIALYDHGDGDPLGAYLSSLDRLADTPADTGILPSHEHRFTGAARRAADIASHHEAKLAELAGLLDGDGASLWELSAQLPWKRGWDAMEVTSRRMAAAETAAHARTLERRGQAVCSADGEGVLRWRTAGADALRR